LTLLTGRRIQLQLLPGEVADRNPGSDEPDGQNHGKDQDQVLKLNINGISRNDKGSFTGKPDKSETDLHQANGNSQQYAGKGAHQGNHPAFKQKNPFDKRVGGPHTAQNRDVFRFVNDQHGKAAENVEGSNDQDECQDQVSCPFFRFHGFVQGVMLLVFILHEELSV